MARARANSTKVGHVFIDYRCHVHGVIRQGDTLADDERLDSCPTCGGPIFVAPSSNELD
jgi:hypothetical protein